MNTNNEELLEANYINDKDLYGLKFKDILNKYIAVENNNLKEFASKLGIGYTDMIPDKIESTKVSQYLNYEEITPIFNKYINIAIQSIPEDNYSKIKKQKIVLGDKTVEADGYQIKLKTKDIQSIFIKVLENAKKDEDIFNLTNKYYKELSFEDYQSYIDEMIGEISGEISKEQNVEILSICVYKQGKNTIKLSLNISNETKKTEISLNKTKEGMMIIFNLYQGPYEVETDTIITILKTSNTKEQETFEIKKIEKLDGQEQENNLITLTRIGELTSSNVEFRILSPLELDNAKINIEFKATTNFSATPQLEEFTDENHMVINGATSEQLIEFFNNLGNRIKEKFQREALMQVITNQITMKQELMDKFEDETINDLQNDFEEESTLIDNEIGTDNEHGYTPDDFRERINSSEL